MQQFAVNAKIIFGENALSQLATIQAKRAFIVTDAVMVNVKAVDRILDILREASIPYEVFSDVKPDPSVDVIAAGIKKMLQATPDLVIALGGGSVIDAAKGILYSLWQMEQNHGTAFKRPLFIAVPSTSGTGSEVTAFTVITMDKGKVALVDDWMVPDIAIVDPAFAKSVPPGVTADTGIDVLCHALEAYVSTHASDYTDAICEKVVKLVFDHLLDAYRDGSNIETRERMHNASCMAGIAFTNASLGITHSLAHALGGMFHIPHGKANAILLPYIIAYNAAERKAAEKYRYLAEMLGLPAQTAAEGARNLILAVNTLKQLMKVPMYIADTGVTAEVFEKELPQLSRLAIKDNCTTTNPRKPSVEEIAVLYRQAFQAQ
jgi:alcohol dehydrogenase class IV